MRPGKEKKTLSKILLLGTMVKNTFSKHPLFTRILNLQENFTSPRIPLQPHSLFHLVLFSLV